MIKIENKNISDYKSIRVIIFIPLLIIVFLVYSAIMTLMNHQLSFKSSMILSLFFLVMLLFINYLFNLAKTRYYEIIFDTDVILYKTYKYSREIKMIKIKKVITCMQNDISGKTEYLILVRKGLGKSIVISNYKQKRIMLSNLELLNEIEVEKKMIVKENLISQFITFYYLTFR